MGDVNVALSSGTFGLILFTMAMLCLASLQLSAYHHHQLTFVLSLVTLQAHILLT